MQFLAVILKLRNGVLSGKIEKDIIQKQTQMKKVTSIGGIFFKCKNPEAVREWYSRHLGFNVNQYGSTFEWRNAGDNSRKGFTQWSPFNQATKYFEPSDKEFMINYRVENLASLVEQLKLEGVTILDEIQKFEYGLFVHIIDIEGNKIELWEPNDSEYEKIIQASMK
jgi:predicted enzyme related to lactoylglutathione lyase